jgi:methyl coenzyme M reductase subunit C-like uncharacterized protein (methanogenesis marker protein 7)
LSGGDWTVVELWSWLLACYVQESRTRKEQKCEAVLVVPTKALQEMEPEERVSFLGSMWEAPFAGFILAVAAKMVIEVLTKIESGFLCSAGPSA